MVDANAHADDVVVNRLEPLVLALGARILDDSGDAVFHQQGLENVRDLVGQPPVGGQFSVEERNAVVQLLVQFLVGEPDEIGEVGGDKFVGVGDLKFELGAG